MELFDIVDDDDRVIGTARRDQCHGDPGLVHRAVHVLVINAKGDMLLQKRSTLKDIQPGKWDTSVGGHLEPGESYRDAALREMVEELRLRGLPLTFLYRSRIRNRVESENIATFLTCYDGTVAWNRQEIDAVRYWPADEIDSTVGTGVFTPNFEEEWAMFKAFRRRYISERERGPSLCVGDSFPNIMKSLGDETSSP